MASLTLYGACSPAPASPSVEVHQEPKPAIAETIKPKPAGDGTPVPRLGLFKVGDDQDVVEQRTTPSPGCTPDPFNPDCYLQDASSIRYDTADGAVWRVYAGKGKYPADQPLPFGVKFGDTRQVVEEKVAAFGAETVDLVSPKPITTIVVKDAYIFEGDIWWFFVFFELEDNGLVGVSYNSESL